MSRADNITALNRKCAKAKLYPRKQPDALTLYYRAIWDDCLRRGEESKRFMDSLMKALP